MSDMLRRAVGNYGRGLRGLPQDTVIAANSLIGKISVPDSVRQWPGPDSQYVPVVQSIVTPASGVLTQVLEFDVPAGNCFVMDGYRHSASISGNAFTDGSGDILWTISVNSPIAAGSNPFAGYGLPYMTNMADQRGSQLGPWPMLCHMVFNPYDQIRYTVITTNVIPVGIGNTITCGLFGWLAPQLAANMNIFNDIP